MATDTVVKNFILNKMTKEQYDALATKDANQLYFLLDAQSEPDNPTSFYNHATSLAGKNFLIFTVPGAVTAKSVTSDPAYFYNTSPVELLLTVCTDSPSSASSNLELKVVFNRSGAKVISEYATGIFEDAIYALYYNEDNHYNPAFVVELTPNLAGDEEWAVISSFYGGRGFGWAPSAYFANVVDAGQFTFIENVPVAATSVGTDNNGLEGDYCSKYGIVDETRSGLPRQGTGNQIIIPAGLVLDVPGVTGLTTNATTITHDLTSTTNCEVFLAQGTVIEATKVYWQLEEPEDGQSGYLAWWNGTEWKFKSNDTGNVWRAANAVRFVKCIFTDGSLTRLCFTGCRLANKQEYLPAAPTTAGTYVLKATVAEDGSVTTQWVAEV